MMNQENLMRDIVGSMVVGTLYALLVSPPLVESLLRLRHPGEVFPDSHILKVVQRERSFGFTFILSIVIGLRMQYPYQWLVIPIVSPVVFYLFYRLWGAWNQHIVYHQVGQSKDLERDIDLRIQWPVSIERDNGNISQCFSIKDIENSLTSDGVGILRDSSGTSVIADLADRRIIRLWKAQ